MNQQRLLKLAEVLENFQEERRNLVVPLDKFDLNDWTQGIALNGKLHRDEDGCGTAACALGTAMLHPWFRKRGLTTDDEAARNSGSTNPWPSYQGMVTYTAGADFFGIEDAAAQWLFNPDLYPKHRRGPKSVAKRIRTFVETGKVPA